MIFFILTDKGGLEFTSKIAVYAVVAGLFYCLASFTTYIALECGSYVVTRLIISYGILVTIIQGFMLGEAVTVNKCIGIIIILVSLFFVKENNDTGETKISKKWIISISITVVSVGIYGILQRHQQIIFENNYTNEFMIISLGVSGVFLLIGAIVKEGKDLVYVLRHGGLYAVGAGLSNGATNLLTLWVYVLVPLSYSAPVKTGLSIIYSFIVSKVLFKEKFSGKQLFGVFLGMIALVILNI